MESQEVTNKLLKNKYDLHKSSEAETAAKRTEMRTAERVPQDPLARIQNYLNRFHEIIDRGGPQRREHNLDLIKGRFHEKYVIKPDEIPESFWENQRRIIRERGQGADLERVDFEELKRQNTEAIIADQQSSLDKWIDYLASPDAPYSDALKYWTLRNILNMAEYDKKKKIYPQRSKGTTKPFPDLNREALAYVLDAVGKKYSRTPVDRGEPAGVEEQDQKEFDNLLRTENFPKLYAWAIEKVTPASAEELSAARGEWVKYNQGEDYMPLVQSLQGHGTGWCTAAESTAQVQLQNGDFYVYYSFDKDGKPTVPRAAIRMQGNSITEIRGVAAEQNLDPYIGGVVEDKLREFPDGTTYQKKAADMKRLTEVENKAKNGQDLRSEDLVFLYEIDSPIEGFGHEKDPRIEEMRKARNQEVDMSIVFDCEPQQIATNAEQIDSNTRAYVGKLTPGIFDVLQRYNIDHIYTSFPEGKIRFDDITIGGKSEGELEKELAQRDIQISGYARDMMRNKAFTTFKDPTTIRLVRLPVRDLDTEKDRLTTAEVFRAADELGLDKCPAEVGPHYRIQYADQPMHEWLYMGMEPIADSDGGPRVFHLERYDDGLWLDDRFTAPSYEWGPAYGFVFSLRPPR